MKENIQTLISLLNDIVENEQKNRQNYKDDMQIGFSLGATKTCELVKDNLELILQAE